MSNVSSRSLSRNPMRDSLRDAPRDPISGRRKAAILITALGEAAAQRLYRALDESALSIVTSEIVELQEIPFEETCKILEEFLEQSSLEGFTPSGGLEFARKLLIEAVGEERALLLLDKILLAKKQDESHFLALQQADPQRVVKFLEAEHPQTIALVLAHMDAKKGSALLMLLPEAVRAQAVRRLAEVQQFSPEMARKIAVVLHQKLSNAGEQVQCTYSGHSAVADLLNRMNSEASKMILQSIESEDSKLALGIRNLMFTFPDLITAPANAMREIISASDKKMLMLALKGAPEELRAQFFHSMSSRAVESMQEDMEALGPVRSKDVSQAQSAIVALARQLEADGKIVLRSGADDDLVL